MTLSQITTKSDMFSVGLTLIEILFKLELPKSGAMWNKLRSGEFDIDTTYSNIQVPNNMILIVKALLNPIPAERPSCLDLLSNIPELQIRANLLGQGLYQRKVNPCSLQQGKNNFDSPKMKLNDVR